MAEEPWLEVHDVETGRRIAACPLTEPQVLSFPATADTFEASRRQYRFELRMVAVPDGPDGLVDGDVCGMVSGL